MLGRTCKRLGYAVSVLAALGTGPALIPFFINTDSIINIYSQTPDVEPISGWYGPGAWLAYILTTMNALRHHFALSWHMIVDHTDSDQVTCVHCLKEDWDTDWLVSLVYTSFSSVDLIRRSIQIVKSGQPVTMQVLPALRASATAVYIGLGVAELVLTLMLLIVCSGMYREQPDFFKKFVFLRWRLLVTIVTMYITAFIGVAAHEKASPAQDFLNFEPVPRDTNTTALLSIGSLRTMALNGGLIKALLMFQGPLGGPWWELIVYFYIIWGIIYVFAWRELPLRLNRKDVKYIVGGVLFLALSLPVTICVVYYLVAVIYFPSAVALNLANGHELSR
jgi:hypothetical protein